MIVSQSKQILTERESLKLWFVIKRGVMLLLYSKSIEDGTPESVSLAESADQNIEVMKLMKDPRCFTNLVKAGM